MTDHDAGEVTACIREVDLFEDVKTVDFHQALADGRITLIPDSLVEDFLRNVLSRQVNPGVCAETPLKVVYTPLNGTGNKPVREVLRRIGVSSVTVVPEQEKPDGRFPTAPYPNPEIREAFGCASSWRKGRSLICCWPPIPTATGWARGAERGGLHPDDGQRGGLPAA